ncbi:hypothetical protein [Streptomyces sp. NPDC059564]|uniref:hypothetical protein n=1 Tax=Streptomyces sp. NPDC059564 TaxID=3346865 RepID=UPI0036C91D48
MTNPSASGPDWTAMNHGDFDTNAPITVPVRPGPGRIYATPDRHGTQALFGEQPPARARQSARSKPGDTKGQEELF